MRLFAARKHAVYAIERLNGSTLFSSRWSHALCVPSIHSSDTRRLQQPVQRKAKTMNWSTPFESTGFDFFALWDTLTLMILFPFHGRRISAAGNLHHGRQLSSISELAARSGDHEKYHQFLHERKSASSLGHVLRRLLPGTSRYNGLMEIHLWRIFIRNWDTLMTKYFNYGTLMTFQHVGKNRNPTTSYNRSKSLFPFVPLLRAQNCIPHETEDWIYCVDPIMWCVVFSAHYAWEALLI